MKPFEIFKSGNHTSSQGEALAFSDVDLQSIAKGYDPAIHHAPIVIGHPKQDGPAYGWIEALSIKAGKLVAAPGDLDPAFTDLVKDGKFRKVSAAFYKPDSANNPVPGSWYLRHVGFLGAAAPAVKGLKPIEFSDAGDTEFADIEFDEWRPSWLVENLSRMFRGMRDYFIEKEGLEAADRILPAWEVEQVTLEAADLRSKESNEMRSAFSEQTSKKGTDMTKEELAAAEARLVEINTRENALKVREAEFSEKSAAARKETDTAFVSSIVKEGRLPIGLAPQTCALFADLSEDEVTFSDGTAEVKTTPRAAFRDLLSKLPVPVTTGELARGDTVDFSDAAAATAAIKTEITEAASKGETISPAAAAGRLKAKG